MEISKKKPAPDNPGSARWAPSGKNAFQTFPQELLDTIAVASFLAEKPTIILPDRFRELGPEAQKALKSMMSKLGMGQPPSDLGELPQEVAKAFTSIICELKVNAMLRNRFQGNDLATDMFNRTDHLLGIRIGLSTEEARLLASTPEFEKRK